MCGIFGLFLPTAASHVDANLTAMLSVLKHRGPDGDETYVSEDRRYQVGFRRLAIIDLETSNQPIIEQNGDRVLMGNGEIYNYLELRKNEPRYPYQTSGDMEVILPLMTRYGDDFIGQLNGMFGLALYEKNQHRLLLVRDRLGIKPVYWAKLPNGGVLFASEIKALFASGLLTPSIDETAVSPYLAHGYVPAPKTLFKGVQKLPPGHQLTVDAKGEIAVKRYWRAKAATDVPSSESEIAEYLESLLDDCVRLQLRSDVPVGALLSGGLDSGLMVALAAKQSSQPLNTYTVSFEGAAVDEGPLATAVAQKYGTNHTNLSLPSGDISRLLPLLAWHIEEPLNDAALLPNFLIEKELGQHVKVALNGTGGDELFAGYGRYFQLPVEKRFLSAPNWMQTVAKFGTGLVSPMTQWQLGRAEKFFQNRGQYIHEHSTHFPKPVRDLIGNFGTISESVQSSAFREFEGEAQSGGLYADLCTYLPDDLLTLLDRTSMAVSVEGRVPFLDHRFVEACLAVPQRIRTPDNQQKYLERKIATKYLPEEVLNAPKQGFASPVPAWITAGLGPLAKRLLTNDRALERGWWTADGINRLLAQPDQHGFRVYSLLMLELAVTTFIESPTSDMSPPNMSLNDLAEAA
jgi:asparagine synthase (glutamine-hydrolysing)